MQLPNLSPWMTRLMVALVGLYVAELLLPLIGVSATALIWQPLGQGFQIWQPLTHFAVHMPGTSPFNIAISMLVLYFFLPAIARGYTKRQLLHATGFAAAGGIALPLLLDAVGLGYGAVAGWSVFITGMVVLFGLSNPNAVINLYFVLPVKAVYFVWGSIALAGVYMLYTFSPGNGFSLSAAEHVGVWAGAYLWYQYVGPGQRRRRLKKSGSSVFSGKTSRFQVYDGGRNGNDDQTWH